MPLFSTNKKLCNKFLFSLFWTIDYWQTDSQEAHFNNYLAMLYNITISYWLLMIRKNTNLSYVVKVPIRNCINYIMTIKYIISPRFQHFKESKDIWGFLRVWLWNLVTIFVRNFFFSFCQFKLCPCIYLNQIKAVLPCWKIKHILTWTKSKSVYMRDYQNWPFKKNCNQFLWQ